MMNSLKIIFGFLFSSSLLFCQNNKIVAKFQLDNKLAVERISESVEIPSSIIKKIKGKKFLIKESSAQKEIPYQLLTNGNLLVQVDFKSNEKKNVDIIVGNPSIFESKVYGRFVPERYDDFAWENDQIAFRMYGKALEKNPNQNAWGTDVWSKRTNKMVIDKWYKLDNYHQDNGEGLDFFKVGNSLGSGDILPFVDNQFVYLGNYSDYKILENGPIRFSFELYYPQTEKNGYKIYLTKKISLDAGSQLNKVEVTYHFENQKTLTVFAGIVHWNENGKKTINSKEHFASYWPNETKEGIVGTAILFPNREDMIIDTQKHLGIKTDLKSNESITYYTGAAWNKAGEITNEKEWNDYLTNFSERLTSPILIKKR